MNQTLNVLGLNHFGDASPAQWMKEAMAEPNAYRRSLLTRVAIVKNTPLEPEMDRWVLRSTLTQLTDAVMAAEGGCLMPFIEDPLRDVALMQ